METNQLLINYYKKEELKKAKNRQQDGMTMEEIIRLANKEYVSEQEIKENLQYEDDDDEDEETEQKIDTSNNEEQKIIDENDVIFEDEEIIDNIDNKVVLIEDSKLEDYPNQPFKLYDEEKKKEMKESIRLNGIMQPLIVRPISKEKYQILAGHNRRACAREIGMNVYPCIVKEKLSEDEAMIYLVDTNLCTRETISTMERAKAYRIKYDTYKRRNIETSMLDEVRKDNINIRGNFVKQEKSSNGSIQRYLRLTHLIPKLQELIDDNKMSINVGEKVSFLPNKEQEILARILTAKKVKLSESIIKRIRKASEKCREDNKNNCLSEDEMLDLIMAKTQNIITGMTIIFSKEEVDQYFKNKKADEVKQYMMQLIEKEKNIEY